MPTDTAFDAAQLEFKLIDQPITGTGGSDLTNPFNEVHLCVAGPPQTQEDTVLSCDTSLCLHVLRQCRALCSCNALLTNCVALVIH